MLNLQRLCSQIPKEIPVKGCLHVTISHSRRSTTGSFVVVKSCATLLGLDLVTDHQAFTTPLTFKGTGHVELLMTGW